MGRVERGGLTVREYFTPPEDFFEPVNPRAITRPSLSRPLHPSRRHLQPPAALTFRLLGRLAVPLWAPLDRANLAPLDR